MDVVGVDDDGFDWVGLGGVDEFEELFVDGWFVIGEYYYFGFIFGGNECVEYLFILCCGDGVVVGLVVRVGEIDWVV